MPVERTERPASGFRFRTDRRSIALVTLAAAFLLAALVPLRGLWLLHTGHGVDMQSRWQETQYFLRGIDPNVYGLTSSQSATSDEPFVVFEDLEVPGRAFPVGVYPPWTYPLALPLHLPASLARATDGFVAINALALAGLIAWAGHRGWRVGGAVAALTLALVLIALGGLTRTLVVGNYGVVVLASLVGSLLALERGRPAVAGLLFGLALLKPTLSGPFVIALLAIALGHHRRAAAQLVFWATATVVLASLVSWVVTGVDPLTSTLAAQSHLDWYATDGGGAARVWETLAPAAELAREGGRAPRFDQYLGMVTMLSLGATLAVLARRATPLEQFGLASTIALTWAYHRPYDSLLVVFLLLALLERAFAATGRRHPGARLEAGVATLGALAVGATLWTPTRHLGWPDSTPWLQGVWLVTAAVLVALVRTNGRRDPDPA